MFAAHLRALAAYNLLHFLRALSSPAHCHSITKVSRSGNEKLDTGCCSRSWTCRLCCSTGTVRLFGCWLLLSGARREHRRRRVFRARVLQASLSALVMRAHWKRALLPQRLVDDSACG